MNIQTRILIVDDSPTDAELISRELGKGDLVYTSKWAKSKEELLKALKESSADIILCDYKMPSFDAPELLGIVKKDSPETPCIVVSGTIGEDIAVEMMKLGAIDYVMKDRLSRLVPAIKRALDYRKIILEHKQAEERLRQSEEKFSKIFRLSPDSIVVTQLKDGIFIDVNQSFINQIGYTFEELIGHSSLPGDLGIWSNAEERQKFIQQLQATGEVVGFEVVFRRKDGSVFNGLISSKIIEIKGQTCTLTLIHDITERKIFLEALNNSHKQYRLVFENMLNGFALHEMLLDDMGRAIDYVYLEMNPAFERMTGIKRDEVVGRKVTEIFPGIRNDSAGWIEKYGKVAAGEGNLQFESYSLALNKWFSINAFSPKKGQFVTMTEDISERKKNEEEALFRAKELEVFYQASMNREERIIELKEEVEKLKKELSK